MKTCGECVYWYDDQHPCADLHGGCRLAEAILEMPLFSRLPTHAVCPAYCTIAQALLEKAALGLWVELARCFAGEKYGCVNLHGGLCRSDSCPRVDEAIRAAEGGEK